MEKRPPPRAVLFDAYGTLFDVYSVGLEAGQLFPGRGDALAQLWRDKQIEYTRLVSMSGPQHYRPFWEITREALLYSAEKLGLMLSPEAELRLLNAYRHLSVFPENHGVLQALKARGIPTAILSNGGPEMLAVTVKGAGLGELLDHVLSVHPTRRYKTDPAAYQVGVDALGGPARELLFVSSNGWDAIGATWFGFTTLWVNRSGAPLERLGTTPHRTGTSLRDVLAFFPD